MGDHKNSLDRVISATMADKMLRRGCEEFSAHVVKVDKPRSDGKFIPTVSDFLDLFLEEIPSLPPQREVKFSVKLILGFTTISMAPYWLAPTELKELKVELQELLDKDYIQSSTSLGCSASVSEEEKRIFLTVYWLSAVEHAYREE